MIQGLTLQEGYSKDILQIIEEGCELEDIFSLLPNELDEAIEDIKKESLLLLKNYDEYNNFFWIED